MRAKWDAAFAQMIETKRAYEEYWAAMDPLCELQRAFIAKHNLQAKVAPGKPLYRLEQELLAANSIYEVPQQVYDNSETLCALFSDAEDALMAAPAPDLAALRWKLDRTSDATYTPEYLAQMMLDMDRLMGPSDPSVIGLKAAA
ncbi:hypothetical protein IP68_10430 [Blastomonas sp. AAP25]|nr:hypothetical protein IP68_10430 [Blastomonas sp. AAP25]